MALSDSYVKNELTPEQQNIGRDEEMRRAFMEEAGLEGVDADYLRKQLLSAEEATAAKAEQLEDIRIRKSRKTDWDEYVDAPRRWGRALHHSDLIQGLRKLIPNLYIIDGMVRNTLGLYIWDRTAEFQEDPRKAVKVGGTVYLDWIQYGWNPEYEIDLVNDVGVAIRQLRGWRTVLMRMMTRRDKKTFMPKPLFTEEQAREIFGDPTNGPTASNFRAQLFHFRNTSPEQAKLNHELLEARQKYQFC